MSHIQVQDEQGVRIITINRPDKLNALSLEMYQQLTEYLRQGEADNGIRAFLLKGQQNCFTSGNDIADFVTNTNLDPTHPAVCFLLTLVELKKPLVAAVTGTAVGIGTTVILHCDLIYADNSAKFMLPFINLGLVPEAGSSLLLPNIIGHPKAAELLMLGDSFDAETAHSLNLINGICPSDEVFDYALSKAKQLAKQPALAIQMTKQLLRPNKEQIRAQMQRELKEFEVCLNSDEAKARFAAFLNK